VNSFALTGGRVIDGTGADAFDATVLVEDGRIARVLRSDDAISADVARVECSGRVVCPGFIDMHSHEMCVLSDRRARSKIAQGITTEVVGNCGMSNAPAVTEAGRAEVAERLAGFGFYDGEITWRTVGEYLDMIEAAPPRTNTVQLVGLGTIRACVMGYAAREATADELARMEDLVSEAMDAGCRGVSTGLIYPPGCYSTTDELVRLAKRAAARGGLYFSHIRGEGDTVVEAVEEVVAIARGAECGAHIAHFKALGRPCWGSCERTREIVARANDEGLDVTYDCYPYSAASTVMSAILPDWAHEGGTAELLRRLAAGAAGERPRLRADIEAGLTFMKGATFDDILIVRSKAYPDRAGETVAKIASGVGADPYDVAFDILEAEPGIQMVLHGMDPEEVKANILGPHAMIGTDGFGLDPDGPLGAGYPHPRSYGSFPRAIAWLVRDEGACPLAEMVAKMTGRAARKLGLDDRGFIREGAVADLVVFDPGRIADAATFVDPHRLPDGIDAVYVAGEAAYDGGAKDAVGEPDGRVLRWSP